MSCLDTSGRRGRALLLGLGIVVGCSEHPHADRQGTGRATDSDSHVEAKQDQEQEDDQLSSAEREARNFAKQLVGIWERTAHAGELSGLSMPPMALVFTETVLNEDTLGLRSPTYEGKILLPDGEEDIRYSVSFGMSPADRRRYEFDRAGAVTPADRMELGQESETRRTTAYLHIIGGGSIDASTYVVDGFPDLGQLTLQWAPPDSPIGHSGPSPDLSGTYTRVEVEKGETDETAP